MKPFTRSWQIVITVLLLCISPVLCQSTESEEYADELWTLNRIYHCPDNQFSDSANHDYINLAACSHANIHDFNAPSAVDSENEAGLISVSPERQKPAIASGCRISC